MNRALCRFMVVLIFGVPGILVVDVIPGDNAVLVTILDSHLTCRSLQ